MKEYIKSITAKFYNSLSNVLLIVKLLTPYIIIGVFWYLKEFKAYLWLLPLPIYLGWFWTSFWEFKRKIKMPLPQKRLTEVDEYGEITINNTRLTELLLWLCEFEDYIEKEKGKMQNISKYKN